MAQPLSGATVKLKNSVGALVATTLSGGDGSFTFSAIASGHYSLTGLQGSGSAAKRLFPEAKPVDVTNANVAVGRLKLASIFGIVKVPDNEDLLPLPNATVRLRDSQGNLLATATTASDGRYIFSALPAGTFTVRAIASGFSFQSTQIKLPGTITPFAPAVRKNLIGSQSSATPTTSEQKF